MTIHTAQGSTTREHISALPAGSQAIDGRLGYSAHTRHELKAYHVTNESAEQTAVRKRRPLNDTREITLDDKWAQVARVLSYQPEKDNALSMLDRVGRLGRGAVRTFHDVLPPNVAQQRRRPMRTRGHEVVQFNKHERSLGTVRRIIQQVVDRARHIQHGLPVAIERQPATKDGRYSANRVRWGLVHHGCNCLSLSRAISQPVRYH
jgi:hypothetical protein